MSTLTLTAYSLTVTLSRFDKGNYPRERIDTNGLIRPYTEPSPRTRALATGAPAATTVGSNVRYYARWSAEFSGGLTVEELGNGWFKASFGLTETTKVAA